ncbi:hypothetical protein [Exiguobacterium aurantiacum]|uniref:hypothetical protein n=1 Tax=Exiguobacterium aurantiacum TaxID=33987 RepID=UPI00114CE520|nr:hypothetical protein [Exiguobacterium aurantiacum]
MMWKRIGILLCVFFLAACSNANEKPMLGEDAKLAKRYLEEKGYEIVSYKGGDTSRFEKEDLLDSPVRDTWSVQTTPPDDYIGRDIKREHFVVRNHLLDDQYELGQTNVLVLIDDGDIIGGTSFPDSKEPLMGAPYSLDGKTAEELHPDYMDWREQWETKYSE